METYFNVAQIIVAVVLVVVLLLQVRGAERNGEDPIPVHYRSRGGIYCPRYTEYQAKLTPSEGACPL